MYGSNRAVCLHGGIVSVQYLCNLLVFSATDANHAAAGLTQTNVK